MDTAFFSPTHRLRAVFAAPFAAPGSSSAATPQRGTAPVRNAARRFVHVPPSLMVWTPAGGFSV